MAVAREQTQVQPITEAYLALIAYPGRSSAAAPTHFPVCATAWYNAGGLNLSMHYTHVSV